MPEIVLSSGLTVEVLAPPKVIVDIPVLPGPKGESGNDGFIGRDGIDGPQGPQGLPGLNGTGLNHYEHIQALPSANWVIEHPLEYKPAVTVVDSAGTVVYGDVSYSGQTVTIAFSAGFSGTAYLS